MGDGRSNDGPEDRFSSLATAWSDFDRVPFDVWVGSLSDAYFESGLGLKFAAALLEIRPAELQAALNLAALPEEDLSSLARLRLPRTTWFSVASASSEAIKSAIDALNRATKTDSPFFVVERAIREVSGPTSLERVMALSSNCFTHAAKKAESFGLLNPKSRSALRNFGSRIRSGGPLTLKQAAFARDLFRQLADGGAIRRDSPDRDQVVCDQILDSIVDD